MNSTTIKRLSVLLLVLTIFSFTGLQARDVYLFSYFVGQSDGLHLAYSYDGRTTVKHIVAKITKTRSGVNSSYFEVAKALTVTDDITVTYSSSYSLKAGDRVTLWKVGSFNMNQGIAITLPELPEGLYWDASNLLKAEGVLVVTNVPTGINGMKADAPSDGKTYTLSGTPVDHPTKKGIYIRNGKKFVIK